MKYTIHLQFERIAPVDDDLASRFLSCLAHICSFRCATDITFQVVSVVQPAPLVLVLELDVEPTGLQTLTDVDIRLNGSGTPERVRSAAVLYLWIGSLRRLMDGPMTAAWQTFRGSNGERSPVVMEKWLVEPPREYLILRPRTQSTETFYTATSTST
jgi:hypothetical protein